MGGGGGWGGVAESGERGGDRWREGKRGTAREKLEETERLNYREERAEEM